MKLRNIGIYLLLLAGPQLSSAQPFSFGKDEILNKIEALQVVDNSFYDKGLFPSQRLWFKNSAPVEDNNVFVTASVAYILQLILDQDTTGSGIITRIIAGAQSNFHHYANRNKEVTYNFWQTKGEDLPFPNGNSLLRRVKYRLPDDYDDTALVELAKNNTQSAAMVRKKMAEYAVRGTRGPVEHTLPEYRSFDAYEVLFAGKMDQEYDVVVMSNVLCFVFTGRYEMNATDHETVRLIRRIIDDNNHFKLPVEVAPYYRSTPLILYHMARMLRQDHAGIFKDLRPRIVSDIRQLLKETNSEMEKMLLYSSLYKLGAKAEPKLSEAELLREINSYVFFQFKPRQLFGTLPVMKWRSEALNLALLLEFITLHQAAFESPR